MAKSKKAVYGRMIDFGEEELPPIPVQKPRVTQKVAKCSTYGSFRRLRSDVGYINEATGEKFPIGGKMTQKEARMACMLSSLVNNSKKKHESIDIVGERAQEVKPVERHQNNNVRHRCPVNFGGFGTRGAMGCSVGPVGSAYAK